MGLGSLGVPGLILILAVALLIFGPKKLPEIGSAFGKTLSEFKNSMNGLMNDDENNNKDADNRTDDT